MMRAKGAWLLATLLPLVLWAGVSQAKLGTDSVSFSSGSDLSPFKPGETQRLVLDVAVRNDALVTDIELFGRGWTVVEVGRVPVEADDIREIYQLEFDIATTDADQPLVLTYGIDGRIQHHDIDLSDERLDGRKSLVPTDAITSSNPLSWGALTPVEGPGINTEEHARLVAQFGPPKDAKPQKTAAVQITVTGKFVYNYGEDEYPGFGTEALVWVANTPMFDWYMGSTVLGQNGTFSHEFTWPLGGDPEVYVVFKTSNAAVTVREFGLWDDDVCKWATQHYTELNGSVMDIGTHVAGGWKTEAIHLNAAVTRAWVFLDEKAFGNIPHVTVHWPFDEDERWWWPYGSDASHYEEELDGEGGDIYILPSASWNDGTVIHEYGHHFVHMYATAVDPDYCNDFCDAGGCPHKKWCRENIWVAYSEGFPNWFAEAVTRQYQSRYGIEPTTSKKFETVELCIGCGTTHLSNAWVTHGFFSALLRDLEDEESDDDPHFANVRDQTNFDARDILVTVAIGEPTTVAGFLSYFLATHTNDRPEIWETCANNGYGGYDTSAPNTGALRCTDHPRSVPSTDNTVVMEWNQVTDDFSGVGAYSYTVNEGYTLEPDESIELNRHATSIERTLAPGSWFFALRAKDRAGNWDPNFEAYGPVIIREPDPGDLSPVVPNSGWDLPLVIRDTPDATINLTRNDPNPLWSPSYWNGGWVNHGEATTPAMSVQIMIDGFGGPSRAMDPLEGGYEMPWNNGALGEITGGRHTLELFIDAGEQIAEPLESDNRYGHQWVWNPEFLDAGVLYTMNPPPLRDGGFASVTDQVRWYNCTGLNMITLPGAAPSPWVLAAAQTVDKNDDVDVRLHDAAASSETGYEYPLASSGRPAGYVDAVIVNAENRAALTYAAGVVNNHVYGIGSDVRTEVDYGQPLEPDVWFKGIFVPGEAVSLFTFDVTTAEPTTIHLQISTYGYPQRYYAAWYDQDFAVGQLLDFDGIAFTGSDRTLRMDIDPQVGTHGLVIWRDRADGPLDYENFNVSVGPTRPDLAYAQPAGWDAPLIPAPAPTVTPVSGPEPTTLDGDAATTYLNLAWWNDSPTAASAVDVDTYVDGELVQVSVLPALAPNAAAVVIPSTPVTVRGGRHIVTMYADSGQDVGEMGEANNFWSSQFVWDPVSLGFSGALQRAAPPDPTADWGLVKTDEPLWFNCDGVNIPAFLVHLNSGQWGAVAVMPGDASDVDLNLHLDHTSPREGFDEPLVSSAWSTGELDFVIASFRNGAPRSFEAGVVRGQNGATQDYSLSSARSSYGGANPDWTVGPVTMAANDVLDLYEFSLGTPRNYRATLEIHEPGLDLGMSLYGPGLQYYGKVDVAGSNCAAWMQPAGSSETMTFSIDAGQTGYYCLAVWKVGAADGPIAGSYTLTVEEDLFLSDLTYAQPTGWDAPLVPRPSNDATASWAPLPSLIAGDQSQNTWMNFSFTSDWDASNPGPFDIVAMLDGYAFSAFTVPGATAGDTTSITGLGPMTIRAGRHSLGYVVDYDDDLMELDETNNTYGVQYVWNPMLILVDAPVYRMAPAPATGGWQYLSEGAEFWPNADGVRTQNLDPNVTGGFFAAVALMSEGMADVDLNLHLPSLGISDGFEETLARSTWAPGHSEFVLMTNLHQNPHKQFDAGIVSGDASFGENMITLTTSLFIGVDRTGDIGASWMESDAIMKLYQAEYTTPGELLQVEVIPVYDTVDLGLSVYRTSDLYYSKVNVWWDATLGPAIAYNNPAGESESVTFVVDEEESYAIAVWKVGYADRSDSTIFYMNITSLGISGAELEELPTVTQLVGAYPNPFNPQTTVVFDLDASQQVKLEIFDLRGRLVRVLENSSLPAGHHERKWSGRDTAGRNVASGVYIIRMTAGTTVNMTRVSLLK